MNFTVTRTQDIALCRALRREVFIGEQGVTEEEEIDELDPVSIHLLAFAEGEPVGTARIIPKGDVAKIGRVCVRQPWRGTGAGAALIRAALTVAQAEPGVSRAVLGAQTHALGFYERLGFTAFGPVYDDAGIPHRDMEATL
jgi:predicted GNAT family N-acyltransferase